MEFKRIWYKALLVVKVSEKFKLIPHKLGNNNNNNNKSANKVGINKRGLVQKFTNVFWKSLALTYPYNVNKIYHRL